MKSDSDILMCRLAILSRNGLNSKQNPSPVCKQNEKESVVSGGMRNRKRDTSMKRVITQLKPEWQSKDCRNEMKNNFWSISMMKHVLWTAKRYNKTVWFVNVLISPSIISRTKLEKEKKLKKLIRDAIAGFYFQFATAHIRSEWNRK